MEDLYIKEEKTDENCRKGIGIIEDDPELVKLYIKLFKCKGISICFIAYNGVEAIRKFSELKTRPPVIIMDNRMPAMTGIDTAKEILKIEPESKIIFLSADISKKEDAMRSGAIAFLQKPVSVNTITQTVCKALN
jgi:two-component system chemotaxis response regulator CheY